MARRKLLICGATGFIGRNLVEYFARRPEYVVHATHFGRDAYACPDVVWHRVDLRRADDVARIVEGIDIIVQAAATTSGAKDIVDRPYIHVTDNAVMNSLLLRAAFDAKVGHFVFFSCSVMYPSSATPLKESDWNEGQPIAPPYFAVGWTKLYIERMCEFFAGLGTTRHTVIRHSNVYGPHDKFDLERSHVFGATVTKVMTARDAISIWGDGAEARDLLYVGDLVDFVARAIERQREPFELVNVGSGSAVSVNELAARIVRASGKSIALRHDLSKPSIPVSLALDCARAARRFEWTPRVGLDDGIAMTLDWWRRNMAHFASGAPAA
jgi:nucleoside-diphosphate-sugar epimerase